MAIESLVATRGQALGSKATSQFVLEFEECRTITYVVNAAGSGLLTIQLMFVLDVVQLSRIAK